jgi:hypothetical protein
MLEFRYIQKNEILAMDFNKKEIIFLNYNQFAMVRCARNNT